jgi:hypothetical protein
MANNVDISILKVRTLQSMIYDNSVSRNDLFKYTEEILSQMELASKEINVNYETISRKLTDQLNTGKIQ